jgi:hypothetical protein
MESYYEKYKVYPGISVADAAYGSAENYEYMLSKKIQPYVKYNNFDKEQKLKTKLDISETCNLHYNEDGDYYVCPMGQRMYKVSERVQLSSDGVREKISIYEAANCKGCPVRGACHKSKGNRRIHTNHRVRKYRSIARSNLLSEEGKAYIKRRNIEVESVFGQIKRNKGFRRFVLRGLEKVYIEIGLIAIVHNIQKLFNWLRKNNRSFGSVSFT